MPFCRHRVGANMNQSRKTGDDVFGGCGCVLSTKDLRSIQAQDDEAAWEVCDRRHGTTATRRVAVGAAMD